MDIRIFIFEDDDYERFYPLTYNRPVYQLLSGAFPIWQKWQKYFPQAEIRFLCRNEIAAWVRERSGIICNRIEFENCSKAVFINGRVLPDQILVENITSRSTETIALTEGNLSYAVIDPAGSSAQKLSRMDFWGYGHFKAIIKDLPKTDIDSRWLNYIWDFIAENPAQLKHDWQIVNRDGSGFMGLPQKLPDLGCWTYKPEFIALSESARIDAQTVLDARGGPIIIDEGVYIAPHSRIEGPCFIGPGTQIVGGKIREGCSFGPDCRVGGEVEESIFLGYSNKYHDGFIGHAYLGEWVNLGAMTTNSDLKNNYGTIRVNNGSGEIDTSQIKVGSFIGDHVKTGIGMLLNTGNVIGFASNLFGGGLCVNKFVPPFVWGGEKGFCAYDLVKAMQTAAAVMKRRGQEFSSNDKEIFSKLFTDSDKQRKSFVDKNSKKNDNK